MITTQIYKNARMLQDSNPNAYASTCCMIVSAYFHLLGMRKTRKCIPFITVGLGFWKWMTLKETSKMQTAFTKKLDINNLQTCWNNTEHHFVTSWATYQLVGPHFIAKKGSCNRSEGGNMVWIKCWVFLAMFNGTIMVVLHVRLRPLCIWFSVQLLPWSGAYHFGISLLVFTLHTTCFFLFFESFHSFVFRFTA